MQKISFVQRNARAGFTLIEIMIAIAIVIILMGLAVPAFNSYRLRAQKSAAKIALKAIGQSIDDFENDIGSYPQTLDDLVRKPTNEALAKNWVAPYLKDKKGLKDPFGKKYVYQVTPNQEHPYELYSYGSKRGKGTPKAEHISVWDL
jgi:type II secretion system protein G